MTDPNPAPEPAAPDPTAFVPPGRYRHFRGGLYDVLGTAIHSETNERLVVYRSADGALTARPVQMFRENVAYFKQVVPRFAAEAPAAPGAEPSPAEGPVKGRVAPAADSVIGKAMTRRARELDEAAAAAPAGGLPPDGIRTHEGRKYLRLIRPAVQPDQALPCLDLRCADELEQHSRVQPEIASVVRRHALHPTVREQVRLDSGLERALPVN